MCTGLPNIRQWGSLTDLRTDTRWPPDLLAAHVAARSAGLVAAGFERGDYVFIVHDNRAHFLADVLAIWAAGGWAVCIDPRRPEEEVRVLAGRMRPKLWLGAGPVPAGCPGTVRLASSDVTPSRIDSERTLRLAAAGGCGVVLLSSGSTGAPKAIHLSYRALCARIALNLRHMHHPPRRTLCALPTHFGHGLIGNCLTPWSSGSDLVLVDGGDLSTLGSLGQIIDDHRIDFMSSVPSHWRMALEMSAKPRQHTIRRIHIGSAPLTASLWQNVIEWSGTREVVNTYGLTETANWVAGASAIEFEPEDGLVGRMWGGRAAICEADGALARTGNGEIALHVPSAMSHQPGGEAIGSIPPDGWLRTGDTGSISDDGVIRLLGRIDHVINRGGIKIQPEEIEWQVERHPAVAEVCAFAAPQPQAGETVGLAIRLGTGESLTVNALRAWCALHMRPEAVPESIFIVAEIPGNERGKVDRRAVAQSCLSGRAGPGKKRDRAR